MSQKEDNQHQKSKGDQALDEMARLLRAVGHWRDKKILEDSISDADDDLLDEMEDFAVAIFSIDPK